MLNRISIYLFLIPLAFSCGKKSSSQAPAPSASPTDKPVDPGANDPKQSEATDSERCLKSGGSWDSAANDCNIPQAQLPPVWASFKDRFPIQFKANVTGNDLSPYLWLYTVPESGKTYTCKDWMVRIGYSRQLENGETEIFKSTDCSLTIVAVSPGSACVDGKRDVDVDFRVTGNASLTEKNGDKSTYRISDADVTHRIVAADDCQ